MNEIANMSEVESSSNSVEENRQNFNIDWRAEKRVFNKQMAYFCMKEEMADVEFVFNRQNKITVYLFLLLLSIIITHSLYFSFRKFLLIHLHLQ